MEERCVCCGAIIAEGRHICHNCEDSPGNNINALSDHRCAIILALADNAMNVSEVSRKMFMHRNTVAYNIERIQKITGKNPLNFWDLCDLVTAMGGKRKSFSSSPKPAVKPSKPKAVKKVMDISDKTKNALKEIGRKAHGEE